MGNVSTTQLIHFIMLMVYMSFCRLNHYTRCMTDKEAVLLKVAVQMTLVIMAFRTTFSMKGGHKIINPYFKTLPSEVRRNIHVVTTRYMEQECTCQNHVQCDIYPTLLTSQVVLPSYEHFLQHLQLTGMTNLISNESDVLSQYSKTILMLILARVEWLLQSIQYHRPSWKKKLKSGMEKSSAQLRRNSSNIGCKPYIPRLVTVMSKQP